MRCRAAPVRSAHWDQRLDTLHDAVAATLCFHGQSRCVRNAGWLILSPHVRRTQRSASAFGLNMSTPTRTLGVRNYAMAQTSSAHGATTTYVVCMGTQLCASWVARRPRVRLSHTVWATLSAFTTTGECAAKYSEGGCGCFLDELRTVLTTVAGQRGRRRKQVVQQLPCAASSPLG